ncbi:MAG: chromosomal replication initiator protein DnaA [Candidatus Omnitrophica bacterium]|nr:chromosomal replication initiator protein DnaA [Candidatus Omnitrophota bacterium]
MSAKEAQTPTAAEPKEEVELWQKALLRIQQELSDQSFKTWVAPLKFLKLESDTIYLQVPDKFYAEWLKDHYHEIVRGALAETFGVKLEIRYVADDRSFKPSSSHPPATPKNPSQEISLLNDRYTLENFVVGPGNRFAHAAMLAVAQNPGKNYNPLFIYGRVGLGKTHLMQGVAHLILGRNPDSRVVYMSGEKFTNQLISAIQNRSTQAFRARYRSSDVLLVDDIHFIAGKESTQEEFFHTFNVLYDAHKQIIVSSDRPPKDIPSLEDRLVSRFGWGLVADIQPPDFETRVAILKKKVERETVSVPDDVIFFIADKIKSNIRELEGALMRVVAYGSLTSAVIDVPRVGEILKDALKEEVGKLTIDQIQKVVCDYFQIKVPDLRAKKRSKSIAYPRQVAMYLVRQMTDHSLPEIGGFFGGRGHATVIHACNKIERGVSGGGKTQSDIEDIRLLIQKA